MPFGRVQVRVLDPGYPVHDHAGSLAHRIEDRLGPNTRQGRQAVGMEVREDLLAAHHARRRRRHRIQAQQTVEPVGRHFLARDGPQVGLRRFEGRARAIGELDPERQCRAPLVEFHAQDGLRAHTLQQHLVGHAQEGAGGLLYDGRVGRSRQLATRQKRNGNLRDPPLHDCAPAPLWPVRAR